MFEKELMICGLRRQHQLMDALIGKMEMESVARVCDLDSYAERSKRIETNLKKLRELKANYLTQFN